MLLQLLGRASLTGHCWFMAIATILQHSRTLELLFHGHRHAFKSTPGRCKCCFLATATLLQHLGQVLLTGHCWFMATATAFYCTAFYWTVLSDKHILRTIRFRRKTIALRDNVSHGILWYVFTFDHVFIAWSNQRRQSSDGCGRIGAR